MMLSGARLTLLIGPTIPVTAPRPIIEALQDIEVAHNDSGRSGFQMSFDAGRSGASAMIDSPLLKSSLLQPFSRVVIIITLNSIPRVLMDGIITFTEYMVGGQDSNSTLSVTGEDVSLMMDQKENPVMHPGQPETVIANKIILSYARYGLIPEVIPPPSVDIPLPIERTPTQHTTDLEYLLETARRFGYTFFIIPGPAPLTNTAYWGPPKRTGLPQKALSVNLGAFSNVKNIRFSYNALSATRLYGWVEDRRTNKTQIVETSASQRIPPLASRPSLTPSSMSRTRAIRSSGHDTMQALTHAQGKTNSSVDNAATANGELDVLRYGSILWPRSLVGLRGAGYSYDGLWYVKSVNHSIKRGEYRQSFALSREGLGSTIPAVTPGS